MSFIPSFCYQKGFWIILGLMVTGGISVGSWGWALVDEVRETALENKIELSLRSDKINDIPVIKKSTNANRENILIICTALNVNCK